MTHYQYLIIGGGMTADAAARGIREIDTIGTIGVISKDSFPPYNRPPLTKALWKGKPVDTIWRGIEKRNVELHLGRTARRLDVQKKMITDDQGTEYSYEKLLLATGGHPRRLQFGGDQIIYYRTLRDFYRLKEQVKPRKTFGVIGGGFIGSEIAAALNMNQAEVTILFPEPALGARTFPLELAQYVTQYYQDKGVHVIPGAKVKDVVRAEDRSRVLVDNGSEIDVDGVVAGIGIIPNTDLAEIAGIEVENGILVNEILETNIPGVFSGGDVANFYNPSLGMRLRVEHEDNANDMGEIAGKNMAGENIPYVHLPFFYSDLFELGYEAVGILDSRLEIVEDWQEKFQKGVVYYLQSGRVRGVLLWNVWGKVDAARELVGEPGPFTEQSLKGRIT